MLARGALLTMCLLLLAAGVYLAMQVRASSESPVAPAAPAPAAPNRGEGAAAPKAPRPVEPPAVAATTPPPSPIADDGATSGTLPPVPLTTQIAASAEPAFDEASLLYDRKEYEEARTLALSLLEHHPQAVRMLRIVVSASCIMGDWEPALAHYRRLPDRDRADMRRRCERYGMELPK